MWPELHWEPWSSTENLFVLNAVIGSNCLLLFLLCVTDDSFWFWAWYTVKCCCCLSSEYCHQKVSYLLFWCTLYEINRFFSLAVIGSYNWCFLVLVRENSFLLLRMTASTAVVRLTHRNSVRLFVTQVDQSEMVQARITKFSSLAAQKTLVSGTIKLFHKFERGHFKRGR